MRARQGLADAAVLAIEANFEFAVGAVGHR
jgi:hypothetical protein